MQRAHQCLSVGYTLSATPHDQSVTKVLCESMNKINVMKLAF